MFSCVIMAYSAITQHPFFRTRLTCLLLALLFTFPVQGLADDDYREVDFPVLLVSTHANGQTTGTLEELTLELRRVKKDGPLQVSVIEETPSGAGDQLRASLWLAASTVALELGNPMTGYRIQVTTHGRIDGPSAGGMMTIALLSALQGRSLPKDFAFTGTILPDGSIGKVGGVVEKVTAAAQAKKKRVLLPASIRLTLDSNSGKNVDLKDHCRRLGLEYVPVSSLREAMAALYREPSNTIAATLPAIPSNLDDLLIASLRRQLKAEESILAFNDERKAEFYSTGQGQILTKDSQAIVAAYAQGSVSQAYHLANNWINHFFKAWYMWLLTEASTTDVTELSNVVTNKFNEGATTAESSLQARILKQPTETISPVLAELDDSPHITFQIISSLVNQLSVLKRFNSESQGNLTWAQVRTATATAYSGFGRMLVLDNERTNLKAFEGLYPNRSNRIDARHRAIETLMYTTFLSVDDAFTANIIQPVADEKQLSISAASEFYAKTSPEYSSYRRERALAETIHAQLPNKSSLYELSLGTYSHAESMAKSAGQLLRFELEPDKLTDKDGNTHTIYRNSYLLRSMLDSAREEAVVSIHKCQAESLGCWASIILVHAADAERDQYDADKLDVFVDYMNASLKAKLTRLLFAKN